ncbi:hypothetical protein LPTSP3_g06350 [Leptospira kobayashii]|uniref:HTH araC/xylS-type domain-containing protein n=2 Tax=Leptospira kobayashii TaxID=1917830 RepID=A0ABN6K9V0_9LEPT|nr:hypothetical protein LPTSP3_g06350 [Leptospira kobayashii]
MTFSYDIYLTYLLFFFSGLSLLFAIGEVSLQHNSKKEKRLSVIFLILSYYFFHSFLLFSGYILFIPFLLFTPLPFITLLGPLVRSYISLVLNQEDSSNKVWILGCLPVGIVFLSLMPFLSSDISRKDYLWKEGNVIRVFAPWNVKIAFVTAFISLFAQFTLIVVKVFTNIRFVRFRADVNLRIVFYISVFILFIVLVVTLQLFSILKIGQGIPLVFVGMIPILLYLIKLRYPELFFEVKRVVEEERQIRKSYLKNLDLVAIGRKLNDLLEKDKVYLDEDLSLAKLSSFLGITTHKLSEYLNLEEKTQYFQLINKYRVEEAKQKILNHPKETFLSIAYSSGFNSKSNFNQVFKQLTGLTPSEFKKEKRVTYAKVVPERVRKAQ